MSIPATSQKIHRTHPEPLVRFIEMGGLTRVMSVVGRLPYCNLQLAVADVLKVEMIWQVADSQHVDRLMRHM